MHVASIMLNNDIRANNICTGTETHESWSDLSHWWHMPTNCIHIQAGTIYECDSNRIQKVWIKMNASHFSWVIWTLAKRGSYKAAHREHKQCICVCVCVLLCIRPWHPLRGHGGCFCSQSVCSQAAVATCVCLLNVLTVCLLQLIMSHIVLPVQGWVSLKLFSLSPCWEVLSGKML